MSEKPHPQMSAEELSHAFEEEAGPVDLSGHGIEDWISLVLFWLMVACVFMQFFTRYILNDSRAWTEEVASALLVVIVFFGSAMCVRISRHIQVDVLYHYLPPRPARILATLVDVIQVAFLAYVTWVMWRYILRVGHERMVMIAVSKRWFYYAVFAGFVLMLVRAVVVLITNYRRGYSRLDRPAAFDGIGD